MAKLIIEYNDEIGNVCPDGKILEYVQTAIEYANTIDDIYQLTIGSSLLFDAFRRAVVLKHCTNIMFTYKGIDLNVNEYGAITTNPSDMFDVSHSIPHDIIRGAYELRLAQRVISEQQALEELQAW